MSTLALFKKRKRQQAAEQKASNAAYSAMCKKQAELEKQLYLKFKEMMVPFNGQTLEKRKLKVVCHDRKTTIELFVDGKIHRVFVAWTEPHYCNCSSCSEGGSCGEGVSYTQEIQAYRLTKKGERKKEYFSWYGSNQEEEEEHFVASMEELIKEYNSNMDWYKHPDGNKADYDEED